MTDKDTLPEVHQGESQPQTDSKPTPSSYLDIVGRQKQKPLNRKDKDYFKKFPTPKDHNKTIWRKP
jgi:hypothetical protein